MFNFIFAVKFYHDLLTIWVEGAQNMKEMFDMNGQLQNIISRRRKIIYIQKKGLTK